MPAHSNGYYGDRNNMKMIVIALKVSQIKVDALKDGKGKTMCFQAIQSTLDTNSSTRMDK